MLSFCAPALGRVTESIRIRSGFCNFGHECPSCRMTFIKRSEQILRSQYLDKNFMNRCCFDGAILKPSRNVMRNVRKHKLSSLSLCGAQTAVVQKNLLHKYRTEPSLHSDMNPGHLQPCCHSAQTQGGVTIHSHQRWILQLRE